MPLPEQFENVTARTHANLYFDGRVVSHAILFQDGTKKTLGVVFPGRYEFDTAGPERMEITVGTCKVELAGEGSVRTIAAGSAFDVPANSRFVIEVADAPCQYICSYL